MMHRFLTPVFLTLLLLFVIDVNKGEAQQRTPQPTVEVCSPVMLQAVESANRRCRSLDTNQMCYGNALAEARSQPGISNFEFSKPGDVIDLETLSTLRLSATNPANNQWGIVLMQVHAEVRNLGRDDVTLLLFGDVDIENQYQDFSDGVPANVNVGNDVLNIRRSPGIDSPIIERLEEGIEVRVIDGPRVADDLTWWNIRVNGMTGWAVDNVDGEQTLIFSTIGRLVPGGRATVFVTESDNLRMRNGPGLSYERIDGLPNETRVTITDGPTRADGYRWWKIRTNDGQEGWAVDFVDGLPTLTTNAQGPRFGPMQAFTLNSSATDLLCDTIPNGILIQTPEGEGEVRFLVNEVAVQMNATVYVEAQTSNEMTINVLEGRARVEAGGVGRLVPEGARVSIPINNTYEITGPPDRIEAYDEAAMGRLPLGALKRPITPARAGTGITAGLGQGDVQITLTWDNDADMDLSVTEPNGDTIGYFDRISRTSGQLDVDSNFPCGSNLGSVENIYWPLDESPNGRYQVRVNQYSNCGDGRANWTLTVRVEGEVVIQEEGQGNQGSGTYSFNR